MRITLFGNTSTSSERRIRPILSCDVFMISAINSSENTARCLSLRTLQELDRRDAIQL